jgi:hypothetical protein
MVSRNDEDHQETHLHPQIEPGLGALTFLDRLRLLERSTRR